MKDINYYELMANSMKSLKSGVTAFSESIKNVQIFVNELRKIDFTKLFNKLQEGLQVDIKQISEFLLKENWYLPKYSMGNYLHLSDIIKSDYVYEEKVKLIDCYMEQIVENEIEDITNKLLDKFENRRDIIDEMINAYKEKRYILCIPVMLAQIEGICNEILGVNFFSKDHRRNYEPKTKCAIEKIIDSENINPLEASTLIPLYIVSKIFDNVDDENVLNRHNILHGSSCKYGSKINADKCIALLGFLIHVDDIINKYCNKNI